MTLLQKLRYRKIKFSGWQMSLYKWRMESGAKVPEGTEYLGSFSVRYKGLPTGTYFDVYIRESSGIVEAFVHSASGKYSGRWEEEEE